MIGRTPSRAARALLGALALVLVTALPGVATASLPAHPAPTHDCCIAGQPMPAGAPCETAPCCVEKPAPRSPSVTTGSVAPPALLPVELVALAAPAAPAIPANDATVVPRARSAPLHLLLVTFLN